MNKFKSSFPHSCIASVISLKDFRIQLHTALMTVLFFSLSLFSSSGDLAAQAVGNTVYNSNSATYNSVDEPERSANFFTLSGNRVNSSIRLLYHSKIKGYQVVYGVAEENATISTANARINQRIEKALSQVRSLGIPESDIYVDVVTQSRVYEYKQSKSDADVLKEEHVGFEMRKNLIIQFEKHEHLWEINDIMAQNEIYDVIKVELVTETEGEVLAEVNEQLRELVESKQKLIADLLGAEMYGKVRISNVNVTAKFPEANYRSYTAKEGNRVTMAGYGPQARNKYKIEARNFSTFYYQGDRASDFDRVVNKNDYRAIPTVDYVIRVSFDFDKI